MRIKLVERTENPLIGRERVRFEVDHRDAPTPSRSEVMKGLSSELGVPEEIIVIEKVASLHGRQKASGLARVYESEDVLREYESSHLIERTRISREKGAEEMVEEAAEEEVEEEGEEEVEGEAVEEAEEALEDEASGEEIDYEELSDLTISEIKERSEGLDLDYQRLLEAEKANKDRKTLKEWLERKIEK